MIEIYYLRFFVYANTSQISIQYRLVKSDNIIIADWMINCAKHV